MNQQTTKNSLKQHTILVTGASDGIGRQAALCYAEQGAKLVLLGRSSEKLQHTQHLITQLNAQKSNPPPYVYPIDFNCFSPSDCAVFVEWLDARISHLDGLLHSAGMLGKIAPIASQDPLLWQQVMQVNLNAAFLLTQALLPLLLKAPHASIIFSSSSVGRNGRNGWGAYAVSKFATEGLMQVLADEYRDSTLRVNCINPGGTRTAMRAAAFPDEDSNKLRTPAEIMPLYLYLMSNDSLHQNGVSFDAQPAKNQV